MAFAKNEVKERPLEDELDYQLRHADVVGYLRNVPFIPGRKFKADFWFPKLKLAVEVDGGIFMRGKSGHTSGVGYHSDRVRDQLAVASGITTMRFTTPQVRSGEARDYLEVYLPYREKEVKALQHLDGFRKKLKPAYGQDTSGKKKVKKTPRTGAL